MSDRYKAYPEYQGSATEWFGRLPCTWKATALKRLCKLRTGLTPPTTNQSYYSDEKTEYPWLRPEDLTDGAGETTASKYLSASGWSVMRPVPANSILICCIGTIGKAGFSQVAATTNQQITAASFEQEARYYFYVILSAREVLDEVATGNVLKILNSE